MRVKNMKSKKARNTIKFVCMSLVSMMWVSCPELVLAATTEEPLIVTGTRLLLAAIIGLATGLIVTIGTVKAISVGAQWINASPDERPRFQKELIAVIIATVVVLTIGSTITYVVGFYQ